MSAKIYHLNPKGSAWLVHHRAWKGGGCTTHWAFVYNFHKGLTAMEAWQAANLPGSPPFYEVVTTQLGPFPCPSVNTNPGRNRRRALEAFKKLSGVNDAK